MILSVAFHWALDLENAVQTCLSPALQTCRGRAVEGYGHRRARHAGCDRMLQAVIEFRCRGLTLNSLYPNPPNAVDRQSHKRPDCQAYGRADPFHRCGAFPEFGETIRGTALPRPCEGSVGEQEMIASMRPNVGSRSSELMPTRAKAVSRSKDVMRFGS